MRSYLIVDDNQALAENLAEIVRDVGDDAVVALSGAEALERARATRFDALVTDMRMPVINGAELVHRIRRADPGLPAMVITAYTNDDDLEAARREGLLAVLSKPVPVERLLTHLAAARRDGLVALVEDDARLADNLAELLTARGFTALTASSVTETDRLGDVKPFVGVVDLRVPGGPDGEAMRRLAAKYPTMPILVITGHAGEIQPPGPYRQLFIKPFDVQKLLGAVEGCYAESHA